MTLPNANNASEKSPQTQKQDKTRKVLIFTAGTALILIMAFIIFANKCQVLTFLEIKTNLDLGFMKKGCYVETKVNDTSQGNQTKVKNPSELWGDLIQSLLANAENKLTFSTGLARTEDTITSNISTGVYGGQTIYGGTGSNDDLRIQSTRSSSKGDILINPDGGKVGVGTSSPTAAFSVNGSTLINGIFTVNEDSVLGSGSSNKVTIKASTLSIPNDLNIDSDTLFINSGSNRVGIGTSDPSYRLDVDGDARIQERLILGTDDSDPSGIKGGMYYNTSTEKFRCYENGAWSNCISTGMSGSGTANYVTKWTGATSLGNGLLYDSGSAVGLGTTTPTALLHLSSAKSTTASSDDYVLKTIITDDGAMNDAGATNNLYGNYVDISRTNVVTGTVNMYGNYVTTGGSNDMTSSETIYGNYTNLESSSRGSNMYGYYVQPIIPQNGTAYGFYAAQAFISNPGTYVAGAFLGNVGAGTDTPSARLETLHTTTQFRISYDANNYTDFTELATGSLDLNPSGTNITLITEDSTELDPVVDSPTLRFQTRYWDGVANNAKHYSVKASADDSATSYWLTFGNDDDNNILTLWDYDGYPNPRVGINTAVPGAALDVYRNTQEVMKIQSDSIIGARMVIDSNGTGGRQYSVGSSAGGAGSEEAAGVFFIRDDSTTLQRLTIDQSGNTAVGTAIADNYDPTYAFESLGNASGSYVGHFFNDGNNADRYGIQIQAGADDGSGLSYYLNALDGNGDQVGYIANNAGTFALTDVSDISTKTNITDTAINAIDVIENLRVVDFNRKTNPNGSKITGFIAQEVQKVYPQMVSQNEDGLLGISKEALVPVLVKGVQDQQAQISNLTQKILAIEASVSAEASSSKQSQTDTQLSAEPDTVRYEIDSMKAQLDYLLAQSTTSAVAKEATESPTLALSMTKLQIDELLKVVGDLKVTGKTTLSDTNIAGKFSVGTITINDSASSINSLVDSLKIQDESLTDIEFFKGVIRFTASGKIEADNIETKSLTTGDIKIVDSKILGSSTIKAGETKVEVETEKVTKSSRIFVTARTKTKETLAVTQVDSGKAFTVEISDPASEELKFDWFIVLTD